MLNKDLCEFELLLTNALSSRRSISTDGSIELNEEVRS